MCLIRIAIVIVVVKYLFHIHDKCRSPQMWGIMVWLTSYNVRVLACIWVYLAVFTVA